MKSITIRTSVHETKCFRQTMRGYKVHGVTPEESYKIIEEAYPGIAGTRAAGEVRVFTKERKK